MANRRDDLAAELISEAATLTQRQLIVVGAAAAAINDAGNGTLSATLAAEWTAIATASPIILEDLEGWLRTHHYYRPTLRNGFIETCLRLRQGEIRN